MATFGPEPTPGRRRHGPAARPGARVTWPGVIVVCAAALVVFACGRQPTQGAPPDVLVFAAASLQTALEELAPLAGRDTGTSVQVSYAATSALARQIEGGAPADLFISADLEWMDYLDERGAIVRASRVNLLGNDLVLIAPAARQMTLAIAPGFALAGALGATGRLAVADPDVPAGRYARAALTNLGVWASVADRLAPAENVRAALRLVARDEAPLGVVYRTDAAADRDVAIVGTFPAGSHPAIVYPAALTSSADRHAADVLAFLQTSRASDVFSRHGFRAIDSGR